MKKTLLLLPVLFLSLSCAYSPTQIGGLYTNMDLPGHSFETADQVVGDIRSFKKGESSCANILGLVTVGDASIATAAMNGRISKIHHVDYNVTNILMLWATHTTIVYGD